MLDSLLFKLNTSPDKEKALLAIPEICADQIITLYHPSLFAGHQGVIKTYLTMADTFFIPYALSAFIYKRLPHMSIPTRQFQTRINLNYRSLS